MRYIFRIVYSIIDFWCLDVNAFVFETSIMLNFINLFIGSTVGAKIFDMLMVIQRAFVLYKIIYMQIFYCDFFISLLYKIFYNNFSKLKTLYTINLLNLFIKKNFPRFHIYFTNNNLFMILFNNFGPQFYYHYHLYLTGMTFIIIVVIITNFIATTTPTFTKSQQLHHHHFYS